MADGLRKGREEKRKSLGKNMKEQKDKEKRTTGKKNNGTDENK